MIQCFYLYSVCVLLFSAFPVFSVSPQTGGTGTQSAVISHHGDDLAISLKREERKQKKLMLKLASNSSLATATSSILDIISGLHEENVKIDKGLVAGNAAKKISEKREEKSTFVALTEKITSVMTEGIKPAPATSAISPSKALVVAIKEQKSKADEFFKQKNLAEKLAEASMREEKLSEASKKEEKNVPGVTSMKKEEKPGMSITVKKDEKTLKKEEKKEEKLLKKEEKMLKKAAESSTSTSKKVIVPSLLDTIYSAASGKSKEEEKANLRKGVTGKLASTNVAHNLVPANYRGNRSPRDFEESPFETYIVALLLMLMLLGLMCNLCGVCSCNVGSKVRCCCRQFCNCEYCLSNVCCCIKVKIDPDQEEVKEK